ncbi:ThuA domain-containing protein [Niallia sp.]|uniref:ThuA domain-containing protein n=1 Tax=Niallia sp. TaxID=2837523 RepID=UPI00289BA3B0|nr:ThuA domain-containing protein [Niallia sp.]
MSTSILAIVGDYYHPKEAILQSLEQVLSAHEKIELEIGNPHHLLEKLAEKPDVVILFSENRVNPTDDNVHTWMTEEIADAIIQFVESGGGWLAWRSGLASYEIDSNYAKMLRGYFKYHPNQHQIVHYSNTTDNDILSSGVSFDLLDEHYFVHCDTDQTTVFLQATSVNGQSIAGWYHTYGNGKVCCLTPTHNKEGLLDPAFIEVLEKCVMWTSS